MAAKTLHISGKTKNELGLGLLARTGWSVFGVATAFFLSQTVVLIFEPL